MTVQGNPPAARGRIALEKGEYLVHGRAEDPSAACHTPDVPVPGLPHRAFSVRRTPHRASDDGRISGGAAENPLNRASAIPGFRALKADTSVRGPQIIYYFVFFSLTQ